MALPQFKSLHFYCLNKIIAFSDIEHWKAIEPNKITQNPDKIFTFPEDKAFDAPKKCDGAEFPFFTLSL